MPKKDKKQNRKSDVWVQAGTYGTFEEADSKRDKIAENTAVQVKVRRRHSKNNYTVHYRNKPEQKKEKKK
jgi:hypothetical protein